MIWVSLSQFFEAKLDQFLTIIDSIFLVKSSYIFHGTKLKEDKTTRINIRLVKIMDNMPCVASIFNMCLPKNRTQILGCSSNSSHGSYSTIICLFEIIFRLTKVNQLDLTICHQKLVSWFQISMCHSNWLKITESADFTDNHLLKFVLSPKDTLLLSLTEKVFKIGSWVHVFADHSNPKSVVHGLVKIISIELHDIWMILYLE